MSLPASRESEISPTRRSSCSADTGTPRSTIGKLQYSIPVDLQASDSRSSSSDSSTVKSGTTTSAPSDRLALSSGSSQSLPLGRAESAKRPVEGKFNQKGSVHNDSPHFERSVEQAGKAGGGEVGHEKFLRAALRAEDSFGSQVAAADGAFHGGGPARGGPVAGEEQVRHAGLLRGAPAVHPGFR